MKTVKQPDAVPCPDAKVDPKQAIHRSGKVSLPTTCTQPRHHGSVALGWGTNPSRNSGSWKYSSRR